MTYLIVFAGAGIGGALRHAVNEATLKAFGPGLPGIREWTEAQNALNHAPFNPPNLAPNNTLFGQVAATQFAEQRRSAQRDRAADSGRGGRRDCSCRNLPRGRT